MRKAFGAKRKKLSAKVYFAFFIIIALPRSGVGSILYFDNLN